MTLVRHELRQGKWSLIIWTGAVTFLMVVCVLLFPEMKDEMDGVGEMFASMGSFTAAFGMDRLNFGTLIGFYGIECGNILGLGGAFFAALTAVSALEKEEKEHTAEFLLTHPVGRGRVVLEKLCGVLLQIVIFNAVALACSVAAIGAVGEEVPLRQLSLLHLAFFLMQLEIAGVCFGISAFLRRGGVGIGLGVAVMLYFMNLLANLSDSVKWLKYITPFAYAESADIITNDGLDMKLVALGAVFGLLGIAAAFREYCRKDIH